MKVCKECGLKEFDIINNKINDFEKSRKLCKECAIKYRHNMYEKNKHKYYKYVSNGNSVGRPKKKKEDVTSDKDEKSENK